MSILWLKVCEGTVLTHFWNQSWATLTTAEKVDIELKTGKSGSPHLDQGQRNLSMRWNVSLKIDCITVNTVLSPTFNHKIFFECAIVQYVYSVVCGFFLTLKFSTHWHARMHHADILHITYVNTQAHIHTHSPIHTHAHTMNTLSRINTHVCSRSCDKNTPQRFYNYKEIVFTKTQLTGRNFRFSCLRLNRFQRFYGSFLRLSTSALFGTLAIRSVRVLKARRLTRSRRHATVAIPRTVTVGRRRLVTRLCYFQRRLVIHALSALNSIMSSGTLRALINYQHLPRLRYFKKSREPGPLG